MKCEYCPKTDATVRVKTGVNELAVCDGCWELLKHPETALPLIRGSLAMDLRGSGPGKTVLSRVERFMEKISAWRPRA